MRGYVYVISNKYIPGMYKVGRTMNLVERIYSHNSNSSLPGKFELIASNCSAEFYEIEQYLLKNLSGKIGREWFLGDANQAVELLSKFPSEDHLEQLLKINKKKPCSRSEIEKKAKAERLAVKRKERMEENFAKKMKRLETLGERKRDDEIKNAYYKKIKKIQDRNEAFQLLLKSVKK